MSEADGGGGKEEGKEEEEEGEREQEEEEGEDKTKKRKMAGQKETVPISVRVSVGDPRCNESGRRRTYRRADRTITERALMSSIFDNESRMGDVDVGVACFPRRHKR